VGEEGRGEEGREEGGRGERKGGGGRGEEGRGKEGGKRRGGRGEEGGMKECGTGLVIVHGWWCGVVNGHGVVPTTYIINCRHLPAQRFVYCQVKYDMRYFILCLAALFSDAIFHYYFISISL
jgi:hypothetical protein